MAIQQEISTQLNERHLGKKMRVLVDRIEGDFFIGRTEFDSPDVDNEVLITAEYLSIGDFIEVLITDTSDYDLFAIPLEDEK
jgi:ribosomal protein S12 methylthiotransferase